MISDTAIQESTYRLSDSKTVADVLAEVASFNREVGSDGITGSLLEKLKEWLERLVGKLNEIVGAHEGQSFTITVGTHITVAVTFSG
jgi:hypothetical protein